MLDARCFPYDPLDFEPRRIVNLCRAIIAEGVAFDEEARDAFHEAMQWPEEVSAELQTAQDKSARHAAQLIGSDNVDAMVMRAWEAQQRRQAEKAAADQEPQP